jgi:drug/metabolite transporter (DMT)-like permease
MAGIVFGLFSAVSWGTGDFLGGMLTRKMAALEVVVWSQVTGLLGIIALITIVHTPFTPVAFTWGAVSGLAGLIGLLALYRGLALGPMTLVAPISACGAIVPLAIETIAGNLPPFVALLGVGVALCGIMLASMSTHDGSSRDNMPWRTLIQSPGIRYAIVAAGGLGLFFYFIARGVQGNHSAVLWSIAGARVASILVIFAWLALTKGFTAQPIRYPLMLIGTGICDTGANALFALATTFGGNLGIISVLGSLYPIATVILAFIILRERLSVRQSFGVALALAGVALMAVG